jgi:aldose 1-epimerase
MPDGRPVDVFTLTNGHGLEVRAISYGAIIVSIHAPDRSGRLDDVVLGHDDLAGYLAASPYFGAVAGRYANRIARGHLPLEGRVHQLAINDPPTHLHGGIRGYDKLVWDAEEDASPTAAAVTYTLTERDELRVDYAARTDGTTVVNLTQHSYFNLAGGGRGDVLGHVLTIEADQYLPVDATSIPTGVVAPVAGTPFDFRAPVAIGLRIGEADEQLAHGAGYDHCYVVRRDGPGLVAAARLDDPSSGRRLDVQTTEPGLQFYSGNRLDGRVRGKSGRAYPARAGLSLETQHFPDSPNRPEFPSTILRPGQEFHSTTVFTFGVC